MLSDKKDRPHGLTETSPLKTRAYYVLKPAAFKLFRDCITPNLVYKNMDGTSVFTSKDYSTVVEVFLPYPHEEKDDIHITF